MRWRRCSLLITTVACLLLLGTAHTEKPKVVVLAAISLREVMSDLESKFEQAERVDLEFVFGASGQLADQVFRGAPCDVLISASRQQLDGVIAGEVVDHANLKVIAGNELVLVTAPNAAGGVSSFEDLAATAVKRIALGEPRSVPAGTYAAQVLKHLKLDEAVSTKLIYGSNVKQVADYVLRGEVDCGLVYASDAAASPELRVVARADPRWHEPIEYVAVTCVDSRQKKAATDFIQFLAGDVGKAALMKRGFKTPTTRPAR